MLGLDIAPARTDDGRYTHRICDVSSEHALRASIGDLDTVPTRVIHCAATNDAIEAGEGARTSAHRLAACTADIAACINVIQVCGAALVEARRPGSIVCVGSLYASTAPDPRLYGSLTPPIADKALHYVASKAAMEGVVRHTAVRLAPHGVRVNCLSPGGIANEQRADFDRQYSLRVPLGRMASVDEVAELAALLSSRASSYVVGQTIRADGGYSVW